jgi:hypothetical protein
VYQQVLTNRIKETRSQSSPIDRLLAEFHQRLIDLRETLGIHKETIAERRGMTTLKRKGITHNYSKTYLDDRMLGLVDEVGLCLSEIAPQKEDNTGRSSIDSTNRSISEFLPTILAVRIRLALSGNM